MKEESRARAELVYPHSAQPYSSLWLLAGAGTFLCLRKRAGLKESFGQKSGDPRRCGTRRFGLGRLEGRDVTRPRTLRRSSRSLVYSGSQWSG